MSQTFSRSDSAFLITSSIVPTMKGGRGQVIMLAGDDLLEALDGIGNLHEDTRTAGGVGDRTFGSLSVVGMIPRSILENVS
jgi:hypothetical protein